MSTGEGIAIGSIAVAAIIACIVLVRAHRKARWQRIGHPAWQAYDLAEKLLKLREETGQTQEFITRHGRVDTVAFLRRSGQDIQALIVDAFRHNAGGTITVSGAVYQIPMRASVGISYGNYRDTSVSAEAMQAYLEAHVSADGHQVYQPDWPDTEAYRRAPVWMQERCIKALEQMFDDAVRFTH